MLLVLQIEALTLRKEILQEFLQLRGHANEEVEEEEEEVPDEGPIFMDQDSGKRNPTDACPRTAHKARDCNKDF